MKKAFWDIHLSERACMGNENFFSPKEKRIREKRALWGSLFLLSEREIDDIIKVKYFTFGEVRYL